MDVRFETLHGNKIQLICGDCLVERNNLPENKYIFVSDPPFNIGYHYNSYDDKMDEDSYYEMLGNVFGKFPHVIIHYPEALYKHSFNIGKFPERVVSWVYNSNTPRQHRDIAFFGVKPDFSKCGQAYKNPTDKRIMKCIAEGKTAKLYDWWEINQVKNTSKEKTEHPCQMPVEVMERIIKILPEEYTIIDPFLGSGTTAIACINSNRNFIGIEKDDVYFNVASMRVQQHLNIDELKQEILDKT